jgi:glycosyltransferase involved in cell wall biosynthesis
MKLSILVITYNHKEYVRQALDSILMQKVDFDFEVILADDISTDGTQEILLEYVAQYPTIFKKEFSTKNLGITNNYRRAFSLCTGEYVAILEGDDYWVSPHKLAKQVEFLEQHRDCVVCFNRYWVNEKDKFRAQPSWHIAENSYRLLTIEQLIDENFIGNFSTSMYRAKDLKQIDEKLFELQGYDWLLNLYLCQYGVIGYLPQIMSVYRVHANGSWSRLSASEKLQSILKATQSYDAYFDYKYTEFFSAVASRTKAQLLGLHITKSKNSLLVNLIKRAINLMRLLAPPGLILLVNLITPPIVKKAIKYLFG